MHGLDGNALGEILNWVPLSGIKRLLSTGDGALYHKVTTSPSFSHLLIDDGSDILMDVGRIWSCFPHLRAIYGPCSMEACLDVSFLKARCKLSTLHLPELSIQFPKACVPMLSNLTHLRLHTLGASVDTCRVLAHQLQSLSVDHFCWASRLVCLKNHHGDPLVWPNLVTLELRQCEGASLPAEMALVHPKLTSLSLHLEHDGFGVLDASSLSNVVHFELLFGNGFKNAMQEFFGDDVRSKLVFPPALRSAVVGLSPSCSRCDSWHSTTYQSNIMKLLPPSVTMLELRRYGQIGWLPEYGEFELAAAPRDLRRIVTLTRELIRSTVTDRWVTLHDVLSESSDLGGVSLKDFHAATKPEPRIRSWHHMSLVEKILGYNYGMGAALVRFAMAHDYRSVIRFGDERLLNVAVPTEYDLEGLRRWTVFARKVFFRASSRPAELLSELADMCERRTFCHVLHLLTLMADGVPGSIEAFIVAGVRHEHVGYYNMSAIHDNPVHSATYQRMENALVSATLSSSFDTCITTRDLAEFLALMDSVVIKNLSVQ